MAKKTSLLVINQTLTRMFGKLSAVFWQSTNSSVQMVKPHIPKIKFPRREPLSQIQGAPVGNPKSLETLITKHVTSGPATSGSKKAKRPSIDAAELPARFKRKPMSNEEMEYIEKGGPV